MGPQVNAHHEIVDDPGGAVGVRGEEERGDVGEEEASAGGVGGQVVVVPHAVLLVPQHSRHRRQASLGQVRVRRYFF